MRRKIIRDIKPAGYLQFWKVHPPVMIVTKLPRPQIQQAIIWKVHPPNQGPHQGT